MPVLVGVQGERRVGIQHVAVAGTALHRTPRNRVRAPHLGARVDIVGRHPAAGVEEIAAGHAGDDTPLDHHRAARIVLADGPVADRDVPFDLARPDVQGHQVGVVRGDEQLVAVERAVAVGAGQRGPMLDLLPAILPEAGAVAHVERLDEVARLHQEHDAVVHERRRLVGVLPRVLERGVLGHAGRNGLSDELPHAVGVFPRDVAEVVIERLQDVREPIQVGLRQVASAARRHRVDFGVLVGQQDLLHRPLLDPVAVHVDGVEDALGQILLLRGRQLALEVDLPILVEICRSRMRRSVTTMIESKIGASSFDSAISWWASQAMELLFPLPAECWIR